MGAFSGIGEPDRRIMVVTGHYGSGKTEFCISLAMRLAADSYAPYERLALVDLDIINPYFRSRERRSTLEAAGIRLYGSAYGHEVTAEIPELAADIRAPLEDDRCRVIVDCGGNDSGALVLRQFGRFLTRQSALNLCVINANRPETRSLEGALQHIAAIEANMGMPVDGLINNTHLLRQTDVDCIRRGHALCERIHAATGKPLWCDCYPAGVVPPGDWMEAFPRLMPLGLYMRPHWLDL